MNYGVSLVLRRGCEKRSHPSCLKLSPKTTTAGVPRLGVSSDAPEQQRRRHPRSPQEHRPRNPQAHLRLALSRALHHPVLVLLGNRSRHRRCRRRRRRRFPAGGDAEFRGSWRPPPAGHPHDERRVFGDVVSGRAFAATDAAHERVGRAGAAAAARRQGCGGGGGSAAASARRLAAARVGLWLRRTSGGGIWYWGVFGVLRRNVMARRALVLRFDGMPVFGGVFLLFC